MHHDAVSDRLELELTELLRVDAAEGFVARVRQRIATEPAHALPSPWGVGCVAVAVAAAIVVIVFTRGRVPTASPATNLPARSLPFAGSSVHVGTRPFAAVIRPGSRSVRTLAPPSQSTASEYEILIDRREALAMEQVLDGIRRGRVDLTPLVAASTVMDAMPMHHIEIAPIDLPRLADGNRQ